MSVARYVLLGLGVAIVLVSGLAYFTLATPKPVSILLACLGVALIAFSNAINMLRR